MEAYLVEVHVCLFVCFLELNPKNYTSPHLSSLQFSSPQLGFFFGAFDPLAQASVSIFSFLSWVSKTQPTNHWTKRMGNTRLVT